MIDVEQSRPTAKIYAFPTPARRKDVSTTRPGGAGQPGPVTGPAMVFGGAWYHDAAIEAERPSKG